MCPALSLDKTLLSSAVIGCQCPGDIKLCLRLPGINTAQAARESWLCQVPGVSRETGERQQRVANCFSLFHPGVSAGGGGGEDQG